MEGESTSSARRTLSLARPEREMPVAARSAARRAVRLNPVAVRSVARRAVREKPVMRRRLDRGDRSSPGARSSLGGSAAEEPRRVGEGRAAILRRPHCGG